MVIAIDGGEGMAQLGKIVGASVAIASVPPGRRTRAASLRQRQARPLPGHRARPVQIAALSGQRQRFETAQSSAALWPWARATASIAGAKVEQCQRCIRPAPAQFQCSVTGAAAGIEDMGGLQSPSGMVQADTQTVADRALHRSCRVSSAPPDRKDRRTRCLPR